MTPSSGRSSIGFLLNSHDNEEFLQRFPCSDSTVPRGNESNQYPHPNALSNELSDHQNGFSQQQHQDLSFGFDTFITQLGPGGIYPTDQSPIDNSPAHLSDAGDLLAYPTDGLSSFVPALRETRAFHLQNELRATAADLHLDPQAVAVAIGHIVTAYNIESYPRLYFAHWHRHGTVLPASTFHMARVQDSLLLAVMCVGGNYTRNQHQLYQLKYLLDVIEHYTFKKVEHLGDEDWPADFDQFDVDEHGWEGKIEDFQAAYLMVVAQYWTGSRLAKRRARQERFVKLVTVSTGTSVRHVT